MVRFLHAVRIMPSTWHRFALIALLTCGCSTTGGTFTQINCRGRCRFDLHNRWRSFSSSPPERAHVDYGVISIEQGQIGPRTPDELLGMLRQMAAQYGCDAVVLAPQARRAIPIRASASARAPASSIVTPPERLARRLQGGHEVPRLGELQAHGVRLCHALEGEGADAREAWRSRNTV